MAGRLHIAPFDPCRLLPQLDARAGLITSPNLAPRHNLAIVRHDGERPCLSHAFWGLTPSWLGVLDHAPHCARAESLDARRMFREAFASRRALIPVTGVYVWKSQPRMKQPFLVTHVERAPLLLAGLWSHYRHDAEVYPNADGFDSAALITVAANALLLPLTDRFPAIVAAHDANRWLDPATSPDDARALLEPAPLELLGVFPVSKQVDNPAHQDWTCAHPTGMMQTSRPPAPPGL